MGEIQDIVTWVLGVFMAICAGMMVTARKPVYSALSFLLCTLLLAVQFIRLQAEFIGVMQVIVYAGAIIVIFLFVIVLFQDAHQAVELTRAPARPAIFGAGALAGLAAALTYLAVHLFEVPLVQHQLPATFGTVATLGTNIYVDYFFPFEVVVMLFLVAVVGAVYVAKRANPAPRPGGK